MRWAWLTHMPQYLTQLGLPDCVVEERNVYVMGFISLVDEFNYAN